MWHNLCMAVGGIGFIAAIVLGINVFKKKKKELMPHFLSAVALYVGAVGISGPAPENKTDLAQTPPPVVSQEPDRVMPSASESESPSVQPDDVDEIKASAPVKPDPEQLEDMARTYLADTFQLELDSLQLTTGIEATVSIPGVSDQENPNQAPEDWEDIQQRMVSAQAQLSDALEMPNASSRLLVRDSGGKLILSIQHGRVNYDAFKAATEPTSTVINGKPSNTTVYVSNRSNTIHSVHDCGGMKNYKVMTLGDADANGYKYCPNCW